MICSCDPKKYYSKTISMLNEREIFVDEMKSIRRNELRGQCFDGWKVIKSN